MLTSAMGVGRTAEQANGAAAPSPKLVHAAQQFEAMMMQELLKPMTQDDALGDDSDGSISGAGSGQALSGFASEALGQALSANGGLGIANEIIHSFSHSGNPHPTGKVTKNLHGNTVMRALK